MSFSPRQAKVEAAARCIIQAFEDYNASFSDITQRAKRRFIQADRLGMTQDVAERYELYDAAIHETIAKLEHVLAERLFSRPIWVEIKQLYLDQLVGLTDARLYQTFFNTVSRRLFKTTGVDAAIEFAVSDRACENEVKVGGDQPRHLSWSVDLADNRSVFVWLQAMVESWPEVAIEDSLEAIRARLSGPLHDQPITQLNVDVLDVPFYRGGRAYRVGRIQTAHGYQPWVLVLGSNSQQVYIEAMLTETQEVSILFGYTFNYFMVDALVVEPVVEFLATLLPSKPKAELYTVLGRVKQGKTERYQSFFAHLTTQAHDELIEAEGKKGMVMLVFTLPSYPLVFKLIRDRFAPSKQVTRSDVLSRYHLVFRHDRVGRLIDAQEFRELKLPLDIISKPLLETLKAECQRLIELGEHDLLIHHCYVERRVRPLDLYLAEVEEKKALTAVLDYGQAIKDLARSNIFAGDLLPKNFGVTGSGRVVFYDYDELRLMSECRFRHWPKTEDDVLFMSHEPWFYVGEDDVFPEQFPLFMGLKPYLLAELKSHHGELFDADWWQGIQGKLHLGERMDVPPFTDRARLP